MVKLWEKNKAPPDMIEVVPKWTNIRSSPFASVGRKKHGPPRFRRSFFVNETFRYSNLSQVPPAHFHHNYARSDHEKVPSGQI